MNDTNYLEKTRVKKSRTEHYSQCESPKQLNLTSLLYFYENYPLNDELLLDYNTFKLTIQTCRNRQELAAKLYQELLQQNKTLKNGQREWHQKSKLMSIVNVPTKKIKPALPTIVNNNQPLSVAKKIEKPNLTIKQEIPFKKRLILPLQQYQQTTVNKMEFQQLFKPPTQRLHAPNKLRAIVEIKFMQENKLIVITNQPQTTRQTKSFSLPKTRCNKQVDVKYSNYLLNRFKKRTITEIDIDNQQYYSNHLESNILTSKY